MRRSALIVGLAVMLGSVAAVSLLGPAAVAGEKSAQASSESRQALATAQAKLAWRLIAAAAPGEESIVSPAGLASVFSIIGDGADAKMASAIVAALGFAGVDSATGLAALREARASLAAANSDSSIARDRIVFAPDRAPSPIVRARLDALGVAYSAADLSKPDAVKAVDDWVKDTTQGAIPEILGQPLDKPSFVALDALHFKAKWKSPSIRTPPATPRSSTPRKNRDGDDDAAAGALRAFRAEKDIVGVDLPFADERFSLVVVTSTEEPKSAKEFAGEADWLSGEGFAPRKGDLALPRFALDGRASLLPAGQVGLNEGLKSPTALAGFGAGVALSQIFQRTTIEVDEEGAEAAAATAIIVGRALEVADVLHMVVDKPFLFALRDRESGSFWSRVMSGVRRRGTRGKRGAIRRVMRNSVGCNGS